MSQAEQGFAYSQDQFRQLIEDVLGEAKRLGASDAGAEVSEGSGMSVSVRRGQLENVERNRDKSLGISVYLGQRRGNASTSDFSSEAIERTVQAAYDIARFTAEDPAAGLPDDADIARHHPELDLFHPWAIDSEAATELALRCEAAALQTDARITNSEGAMVSAQQSHFFSAHSNGFRGGYASSRHSLSVSPIAGWRSSIFRPPGISRWPARTVATGSLTTVRFTTMAIFATICWRRAPLLRDDRISLLSPQMSLLRQPSSKVSPSSSACHTSTLASRTGAQPRTSNTWKMSDSGTPSCPSRMSLRMR